MSHEWIKIDASHPCVVFTWDWDNVRQDILLKDDEGNVHDPAKLRATGTNPITVRKSTPEHKRYMPPGPAIAVAAFAEKS